MSAPVILFIIILIYLIALFIVAVATDKLNRKLDDIERRARYTSSKVELTQLYFEIEEVSQTAFHRTFWERIREIKTFIEIKIDNLNGIT